MENNIEQTVREVLGEQLGLLPEEINADDDFVTVLGADSLDLIEVVMTIEDRLAIVIPDEDAGKVRSVKSAVEYIEKLKA